MSEKRKTGRKISKSPSHNSNPLTNVQHLESLLKLRDERISQLEEKVQDQEVLLQHRLQCMDRLKRERDELRKTNALLIGKTAELTRKQSVGGKFAGSPVVLAPPSRLIGR